MRETADLTWTPFLIQLLGTGNPPWPCDPRNAEGLIRFSRFFFQLLPCLQSWRQPALDWHWLTTPYNCMWHSRCVSKRGKSCIWMQEKTNRKEFERLDSNELAWAHPRVHFSGYVESTWLHLFPETLHECLRSFRRTSAYSHQSPKMSGEAPLAGSPEGILMSSCWLHKHWWHLYNITLASHPRVAFSLKCSINEDGSGPRRP